MSALKTPLALLVCVALGASCRTDIELLPDEETEPEEEQEEPECTAELTPRVEDCARAAPDAVPIAALSSSYVVADGEFLYYASEGRVVRLSMIGGEPEALTPPDSINVGIRYIADGSLYWMQEGVVQRVPTTGGEPEPVVEIAPNAVWAIADLAILSSGPYGDPSPLYRTSLTTYETTELLAADPEQSIQEIAVDGDRALVELSNSLVAVPLGGGEPQLLASGGHMVGAPPIVRDGEVYFGARFLPPTLETGLYRVDLDEPSTPELFLPGFPIAFAFDDDALFAHVVPQPATNGITNGQIVRASIKGGDTAVITDTSSYAEGGVVTWSSSALVVSGCNLYFIERCISEPPTSEARLLTMSKVP
ncbi:MAG: hypothetical protein HOV80_10835 [Polyangiaceae bacterium]|nr:hypothetical protein [Polyangiaceae bacterium]